MAAASYDPGKPTLVRLLADGTFAVPSFRAEAREYKVNLAAGSCTCPQHTVRGARCKHLEAASAQSSFLRAAERAKELTDTALESYLQKYGNHSVIGGALRLERARRKQAQRPPVGTSVKLYGPATDEEAALDIRRKE